MYKEFVVVSLHGRVLSLFWSFFLVCIVLCPNVSHSGPIKKNLYFMSAEVKLETMFGFQGGVFPCSVFTQHSSVLPAKKHLCFLLFCLFCSGKLNTLLQFHQVHEISVKCVICFLSGFLSFQPFLPSQLSNHVQTCSALKPDIFTSFPFPPWVQLKHSTDWCV